MNKKIFILETDGELTVCETGRVVREWINERTKGMSPNAVQNLLDRVTFIFGEQLKPKAEEIVTSVRVDIGLVEVNL